MKLALLGCAIAAVNFKRSAGGKLGRAFEAGHLGLAAYFDFDILLAGFERQGFGFFVKTNELCLEGFGRATCED